VNVYYLSVKNSVKLGVNFSVMFHSTNGNDFCSTARLLCGSTVGYPSDSLAFCFLLILVCWCVCVCMCFLFLSLPFYMFAMGLVPEINLMNVTIALRYMLLAASRMIKWCSLL